MEPAHPSPSIAHVLTPRQRTFLEAPLFATVGTTDANGARQPERPTWNPKGTGCNGWHRVPISVA